MAESRNAASGKSTDDLPGVDAQKPTDIPAPGWRQIVTRAYKETKDDQVPLMAAGMAYFAFLAMVPALIALLTVYGLVSDPKQAADQVQNVAKALPDASRQVITDQLQSLTASSGKALSVGLIISLLAALWSASGAAGNLIKAVNRAYDEQETRGFLKVRGTALVLTIGGIVFVVVALALIAVMPALFNRLNLGGFGLLAVQVLRWVLLVAFVAGALAIVYRVAPDRDAPKMRWVSLGATVATVLWVIGSLLFALYVNNFSSYNKTYGALAGIVVLLLWLYLTSYIVLFGAEVNSEAEHQTAKDTTKGPEKPMGDRRAVMADTLPEGG